MRGIVSDIASVAWKEWREVRGERGLRGRMGMLLTVVVFGVVLPLQLGPAWVTSATAAASWAWVPMFLVMNVIADAVAGERERHTLETLLATRVPDAAILLGKIAAAVSYAGALTLASLALGVITVNVAFWRGTPVVYEPATAARMLLVAGLGAVLVAVVGVVVSLRAPTVRQAQQTLGAVIILATFAPLMLARALPTAWTRWLAAPGHSAAAVAMLIAALVTANVVLLALLLGRFRRARLIGAC